MKRLCLLFTALALLVPAGALAEGPPPSHGGPSRPHGGSSPSHGGRPPVAARAVEAALCVAELKQLGQDAFKAKYPAGVACLDAHADQAAQILDQCQAAADPRACLREALAVSGAPPAPARPQARSRTPLVTAVAAGLCRAEAQSIGVEAFKAKYKTRAACLRANAAKAAGIVKDAQTQCASAPQKGLCMVQAVAKALGLLTRGPRQ
jgi:hypothetical protein